MFRLIHSFVALAFVLSVFPSGVFAFAPESEVLSIQTESRIGGGDFSCFDYYKPSSVEAVISPDLSTATPDTKITFSGDIVNKNDYPLVDGTLYAKVFRKDETTFAAVNSHPVVDQMTIQENINLDANSKFRISHIWSVPKNAKVGEYYIAYYFVNNDRYNLMGLSFTDNIVGSMASFSVSSTDDNLPPTELSKIKTKLNGAPYLFSAQPPTVRQGEEVVIQTTISNPSSEEKILPVQWNQYSWDSQNPDNRRNTKTELITLAPNETKTLSYTVKPQRESIVLVTVVAQDKDAKSILSIRYAQQGVKEAKIAFSGLNKFPIVKGEEVTLFACAGTTQVPLMEGNTITLELLDSDGGVIHSYKHEGQIWEALAGFGESFTTEKNHNVATLKAILERDGVVVDEVSITYNCESINSSKCSSIVNDILPTYNDNTWQQIVLIVVGVGSLLLVLAFILIFSRKKGIKPPTMNDTTTMMGLVLCLVLGFAMFMPQTTQAQNCDPLGSAFVWNGLTWAPNGPSGSWNWDILTVGGDTNPPPSVWTDEMWPYAMNVDLFILSGSGIGSSYECGLPFGFATGGISGNGCTIPAGASGCIGDLTWNITGGFAPSAYNSTSNTIISSNANGTNVAVSLTEGSNNFAARDGVIELSTVALTASCAAGSVWDGSVCAPSVSSGCYQDFEVIFGYAPCPGGAIDSITYTCPAGEGVEYPYYGSAGSPASCGGLPDASAWLAQCNTCAATPPTSCDACVDTGTLNSDHSACGVNGDLAMPGICTEGCGDRCGELDAGDGLVCFVDFAGPVACTPPATASISGTGCTIPTGGNSCNGSITWTTSGASTPTIRNVTTDTLVSSNPNGTNVPISISYSSGSNYVIVRDGNAILDDISLTAACASGDMWNGSSCVTVACQPDGYYQTFVPPVCCSGTYSSGTDSSCTVYSNSQMPYGGSICLNFPTYTCTPNLTPTMNLTINSSDGPLTVNNGDTLAITWTGANVSSCTALGAGWGGAVANSGSASIVASASDTYIVNCGGVIDSVVVNVNPGSAPSAPTITGPTTSGVSVSNTFTISTTDADADTVYYEIDWNNDGVAPFVSTPGAGYVPSGTSRTATQSWGTPGTYTFMARAVDDTGLTSSWTTHTVTVANAPTVTIEVQVNGGSWGSGDVIINPGDSVVIRWNGGTDSTSCTNNFGAPAAISSAGAGVTEPAASMSQTYAVTCTGPGGTTSQDIAVTTNGLPNLTVSGTSDPLPIGNPTIDPVTGNYSSVEVRFQIGNNGQSPTNATITYRVEIDYGSDGSYEPAQTQTGTTGSIAPTGSVNISRIFNNVPFGNNTIRVTVDTTSVVTEVSDADNTVTINENLSPVVNLQISTDKDVVREGQTAVISWNTQAAFPMSCTVSGPSISPSYTFDPNVNGTTGNRTIGPIPAKSEYLLSCTEPVTNTTFTDTVAVEVIPSTEEI